MLYAFMKNVLIKNSRLALASLSILLSLPLSANALEHPIYILHTNDIHCGVEDNIGFAKVAAVKKDCLKLTPNVALVDAGDAIQGAPLGMLTKGKAIVDIMNAVGYDFLIPGNHEFDYGVDTFLKLNRLSKCGYYCANFMDLRTGKEVLPTYKLMEFEDTKVAFVGAVTPSAIASSTPTFFQNAKGEWIYGFCEDKTGKALYRQLQKQVDAASKAGAKYIFLVGHLGVHSVRDIWSSPVVAKKLKHITGVIDGHSHETVNRLEMGKQARIVRQTGTKLSNLGLIIINPDGSLETRMDSRQNIRQKPDESIASLIKAEKQKIAPLMNKVIGHSKVKLWESDPKTGKRMVRTQECNLGNFTTDAFRYKTGADVFVINGGAIRGSIGKGAITMNSILEAFPFGSMLCTRRVTGQQILDCLEMGARKLPYENGGFMHISGGSYTIDTTIPSKVEIDSKGFLLGVKGPYRVKNVMINGEPLDLKKQYVLGDIAYGIKSGGDGMSMLTVGELVQDETSSDLDAISDYIAHGLNGAVSEKYANPYGEGRITIIK